MALNVETKVDSAEKLAAISGKPTENYLFANEVNEIVSAVKELEILVEQNSLTPENFGAFSNGLQTEDDLSDSDKFSYVDSSDGNKQKKTSWLNVKAKLKAAFDLLYQSILISGTNIKTINGTSILGSGNLTISAGTNEIRQYFITHGNKFNLSTIGNYYSSEVELGLTPTTINNSPGNNLVGVMATRWVMPIMYSFRNQKLKKVVFTANDVNFTSFNLVLFMGRRLNASTSRVDNLVIHNQNYTLTGSGTTAIIEITSFTNDITIPDGYELCALYSRLNGTNGTINNVQISGYAS